MRADVAIIGAGIAGASLAAEIAQHASVLLIEAEDQPGYHATGRSAAFWSETYGGPIVQPLTSASGGFLASPPPDFSDRSFLRPRRALHLARAGHEAALAGMQETFAGAGVTLEPIDDPGRLVPGLRDAWTAGLLEPSCRDIDVAALHAAFLRVARRHGAVSINGARVESARRVEQGWTIAAGGETLHSAILVNAAGAWADGVAMLAGVAPLGIRPFRRTMVQLRVDPPAPADMALIEDVDGSFYFKPEAGGRIWLSPHDETLSEPCDCAPEEIDVAMAIARLEQVVNWKVERVERSWAGLRSFAPDRLPIHGFSGQVPDFFWFAGQGGFGIQTAPAAAKLAAALLLGIEPDPMVMGIDPALYAPTRFTN